MPYRKTFKSAYRSARRQFRKDPLSTAEKALRVANQTKKLLNVEFKHVTSGSTSNISSSGAVVHLSQIAQGADNNDRNGRSVKLKSLHVRSRMTAGASSVAGDIVRTMLVVDRDAAGVAPTITEILDSADPSSFRNIDSEQGRFKVLLDRTHVISPYGVDQNCRDFWVWNKDMDMHIKYDGTAGTDISKNGIYLVQVGMYATAAFQTTQDTEVRLRYVDN